MARATKASAKRTTTAATPKRKPGRPVGAKTRAIAPAKKTAPAARQTTRRTVTRATATPAPVRMNKAELEAQVVKLERSIERLRKQNAELKQALKAAPQAEPAKAAGKPTAKAAAKPAAHTRKSTDKTETAPTKRGRRSKAEIAAVEATEEAKVEQDDTGA
jgi:hypothetical protein